MGNTVFITGMSGAGKSRAVNALEDMEYYCVDNLPASLATTFADLVSQSRDKLSNVAIVIDSRDGENVGIELSSALRELTERSISYKVLFLDASTPTIVRRYRETRRRHPLAHSTGSDVVEAVERERKLLMHKREIVRLKSSIERDGYTLVPLSLYFLGDKVKVELGVCKGKKLYDKREAEAQKAERRDIERFEKERNR